MHYCLVLLSFAADFVISNCYQSLGLKLMSDKTVFKPLTVTVDENLCRLASFLLTEVGDCQPLTVAVNIFTLQL